MQEQIFSLTVVHHGDLSTQVVKDWLRETLTSKVSRYIGMVVESFSSAAAGRVVQCSLRVVHGGDVSVAMMKEYLADTPETFKIAEISKR